MTEEQLERFAKDRSSKINFHVMLTLANGRLTPDQRKAIARAAVKAARTVQVQMMLVEPDNVQVSLHMNSSTSGQHTISLEDDDGS